MAYARRLCLVVGTTTGLALLIAFGQPAAAHAATGGVTRSHYARPATRRTGRACSTVRRPHWRLGSHRR